MQVNLIFERSENNNGYATYIVKDQSNRRNLLLNGLAITEWSEISDGFLVHYQKKDKPKTSVWKHTGNLTTFNDYELCKQSLIKTIVENLKQIYF